MREYFLDIPTIIIGVIIYIIIAKLSLTKYLSSKEKILIFFIIEIFGLIYDGFIILIGFAFSEGVLIFFNQLRFILHGLLVPLLILFSAYALKFPLKIYYLNIIITIVLSIFGIILGIITKLKVVDSGVLKRCTFADDISLFIETSFMIMNIGTVIYMIIAGIILLIKNKEYYIFLAGLFMLIFSAIGPVVKNPDINYLLSMYGEVLMVIFLYLYFRKIDVEKIGKKKNFEMEEDKID